MSRESLLAYCSDDPVNLDRFVIINFEFRRNQLAIQAIVVIGVSCSVFQFHSRSSLCFDHRR